MASTYSDLKFELIGTGEQSGTWGTTTNTNLGTAIEEAITGSADVTFASATVTLTLTDTNASQTARNLRLNLTGTSGGAQDLEVPAIEKFYIVNNGCADTITVKVAGQTGVGVPAGKAMLLFNNGTDVVNAVNHFDSVTLTNALAVAQGGTGATTADGALTNLGGTTTGKAVFTAADAAAGRTALGGGTVGGNVFAAATAAAAQQAMDTEVGVDVQAYDAGLADIAGLAVTDGNFIVGDGANWVAESGATARTSLGLGTLATLNEVGASEITDNSVGAAELNVPGNGTAGQYLASDGDGTMTWTTLAGGGFSNMEVFTSSSTWTNPGTVEKVKVTVLGGGGNGAPAPAVPGPNASSPRAGGGGGAGGLAMEVIPFPSGTNVPVTVGGAGGTSSFGAYCSATGGSNGSPGPNPGVGGAGGTGSGGQLNAQGEPGRKGWNAPPIASESGEGGSSLFGGGGQNVVVYGPTGPYASPGPASAGVPAVGYGSGGGGAGGMGSPGAVSGGTGTPGLVIVEY
jgi:hypothetical protein